MKFIILILISYLIGSIPNALWIGLKFKNMDIRNYGSGNLGATNATRVLGWKLGLFTFILDVLKGAILVLIATNLNMLDYQIFLIGFAAIMGHSFSIYLKFKGGKSVATSLGVFSMLLPKVVLILLLVFLLIVIFTQYVSLASITVAILLPILTMIIYKNYTYFTMSLIIGIIIVIRHKSNIINLINGKEDKIRDKAKKVR